MIKATAVLITKDPEYPAEILKSLPEFDEVLIETNCPSVYRRYEMAQKAKNNVIYVQDDDCEVDVLALFEKYNGQITNAMKEQHFNTYRGTGITLVGWGSFFPKGMIDFSPYTDKYGIDSDLLSQADRVFTFLNQPHNPVLMTIYDLPRAISRGRMSTSPGHWEALERIKGKLATL